MSDLNYRKTQQRKLDSKMVENSRLAKQGAVEGYKTGTLVDAINVAPNEKNRRLPASAEESSNYRKSTQEMNRIESRIRKRTGGKTR